MFLGFEKRIKFVSSSETIIYWKCSSSKILRGVTPFFKKNMQLNHKFPSNANNGFKSEFLTRIIANFTNYTIFFKQLIKTLSLFKNTIDSRVKRNSCNS